VCRIKSKLFLAFVLIAIGVYKLSVHLFGVALVECDNLLGEKDETLASVMLLLILEVEEVVHAIPQVGAGVAEAAV
jgi:hypothetical protein